MAMDRLNDDELIELLGTLGVLRLEVAELRETAQQMVPRDELESGRKRMRLIGFIALVIVLLTLAPFAFVLSKTNTAASEAKAAAGKATTSQHNLVQDQYNRAVTAFVQCGQRNEGTVLLVSLVRQLLAAEEKEPVKTPTVLQLINIYSSALKLSNAPPVDCNVYKKQEAQLIAQGAIPTNS